VGAYCTFKSLLFQRGYFSPTLTNLIFIAEVTIVTRRLLFSNSVSLYIVGAKRKKFLTLKELFLHTRFKSKGRDIGLTLISPGRGPRRPIT
jgi:hypothetical protein